MTENDTTSFAYFPVPGHFMAAGFFLTGAGSQSVSFNDARKPPPHPGVYSFTWDVGRVLPEYQLVYLNAGAGEFESHETGRVDVNPGMAMILMPDVWHRYRPHPGKIWTGYWISFGGEIPHIWQRCGVIAPATAVCTVAQPQAVAESMMKIVQSATGALINAPETASFHALALMATILGDMATTHRNPVFSQNTQALSDDALVNSAIRLIWNHSHRDISVDEIARQLHTTCRTLERRFLTVRKRRVFEELTDCRLSRAQRMLRETHLPIKRIAYVSGFTSPTHLLRVFRRRIGLSPGEYRKT